ncbi:hypothetical protein QOT17_010862 [Balamuthia mandrillaris]
MSAACARRGGTLATLPLLFCGKRSLGGASSLSNWRGIDSCRRSVVAASTSSSQRGLLSRSRLYSTEIEVKNPEKRVNLVITCAGPDKPGVTAAVTACIAQHHGNIEAGKTTRLGNDYCIHMMFSLPEELEESFRREAKTSIPEYTNWDITIRKSSEKVRKSLGLQRRLLLTGADHPGISHAVADFFGKNNINIDSLQIYTVGAAFSGEPLFKLDALIDVPKSVSTQKLEEGIRQIGEQQGVDIWIEKDISSIPKA